MVLGYIEIKFNNGSTDPNYADAAIASIDGSVSRSSGWQFAEAKTGRKDYQVSGTTTVKPRDTVRKSGRTSNVTTNKVIYTDGSAIIDYGSDTSPKPAYFTDQIIVKQPFIKSGDSGSCVDKNGKFAGLAFAASPTHAIVCKAEYFVGPLGINVGP